MTKHTPQFLRARVSNLSLQAASPGQPAVLPPSLDLVVIDGVNPPPQPPAFGASSGLVERPMSGAVPYDAPRRHGSDGADGVCQARELDPDDFAAPFCEFLTRNPTIFHALEYF